VSHRHQRGVLSLRLRSVLALTAIVATSLLGTPTQASADTGAALSVALSTPATDPLAGVIPVGVHIGATTGATPAQVTVFIHRYYDGSAQKGDDYTITRSLALGTDCAEGCDVTVDVDTLTMPDLGTSPGARQPLLSERSQQQQIDAWVTGTGAGIDGQPLALSASATPLLVNIDNHRRGLFATVAPGRAGHADVTVYSDGDLLTAPLRDVQVTLLAGDAVRTQELPADAGSTQREGRATGQFDLTGIPNGMWTLRLVGSDTDGKATNIREIPVSVYAGPHMDAEVISPVTPSPGDASLSSVRVTYSLAPGWDSHPQRLRVLLDSTTVLLDTQNPPTPDLADGSGRTPTGTVTVPLAAAAAAVMTQGPHQVHVQYIEDTLYDWRHQVPLDTQETSTDVSFDVQGVTVATAIQGPVAEGTGGSLLVTATGGPAGAERTGATSWVVRDRWDTQAAPLVTGHCSNSCTDVTFTAPLASLQGSYPGLLPEVRRHELDVAVTDTTGTTTHTYRTVFVDARLRMQIQAPAKVGYGARARVLVGVQQSDNAGLPGVPVTLQRRLPGTTTWVPVASASTNSLGQAVFTPVVSTGVIWRALVAARPGYNGPGSSPWATTAAVPLISVSGLPGTAIRGRTYTLSARLYPARTVAQTVQLRVGTGVWRTVAVKAGDRYGVTRTVLRFGRGVTYVRVLVPATPGTTAGSSRVVTVHVA